MSKIEIFIDKSKFKISIVILSSLTIIFAILTVLCIQNGWTVPFLMDFFLPTVFIIATVAFGVAAIYMLTKSKDNSPVLIIDNEGFIDNSGMTKGRLIKWEEISSFEIKSMMGMKMILVKLKDPEGFINSFSGMKKSMMKSSFKQNGTPISLAGKALSYDFDKLFAELKSRLNV